MLDIRPILMVNGLLLSILAGAMLLPALMDYYVDNPDWQIFLLSAAITGFIGISLYLTNRGYEGRLELRQTFMFTVTSWFLIPLFAALPLMFSAYDLSLTDAYFEATSGLTATGATLLSDLDHAPPGLLFWRALLQGLGGIGVIVLAMAIFPMLRIGGMQLFRTESSDNMEKILPRATHIAGVISLVFLLLVFLCAALYWLAGMSGFDAICHALTTVATGGFSNYDASLGHFNNPNIELIAMVFMVSGALPIILYFQMLDRGVSVFWRNPQVRWFLGAIVLISAVVVWWLVRVESMPLTQALRQGIFSVITVITTGGYTIADYSAWGAFPLVLFFMLIVVGGCTGSTSGGIKIFRFQVLYELAKVQMAQIIKPHGVFLAHYNNRPVSDGVAAAVMSFFILFTFAFLVLAVALSLFGLDFLTSMSTAAQALANVGPALGPVVGPSGNYASLPDGATWLVSFAMILGRLELFTVLILFTQRFWRD